MQNFIENVIFGIKLAPWFFLFSPLLGSFLTKVISVAKIIRVCHQMKNDWICILLTCVSIIKIKFRHSNATLFYGICLLKHKLCNYLFIKLGKYFTIHIIWPILLKSCFNSATKYTTICNTPYIPYIYRIIYDTKHCPLMILSQISEVRS